MASAKPVNAQQVLMAIQTLQAYAKTMQPSVIIQQKLMELSKKLKASQDEVTDVQKYRQLQQIEANPQEFFVKLSQMLSTKGNLPFTPSPYFR
jgi:hypothetical protein